MTDKEKLDAIRAEIHRLVDVRGYDREMANDLFAFMDSLPNEPVSDDLEKAAEQDVCEVVNTCSATGIPNDHIPSWVQDAMINEYIHGAKWKEEQFEKNRLEHCNSITNEQAELEQGFIDQHIDKYQRMPTFLDAIEYGMRLQKEQMMKDAYDAYVSYIRDNSEAVVYLKNTSITMPCYFPKKDLEEGDKVKIVIVKSE